MLWSWSNRNYFGGDLMRLWIDGDLDRGSVESFLNESFDRLTRFCQNHLRLLEDCGAFIRKESYILCFCAQRRKELELFVVSAQGAINGKENFENLISTSSSSPIEYEWKDIEEIELPPPQSPFPEDFPFNITFEERVPNG